LQNCWKKKTVNEAEDNELKEKAESVRRQSNDLRFSISRQEMFIKENEKTIKKLTQEVKQQKNLSSQVSRIQNDIVGKKKEIDRLEEGFDPQHINEMIETGYK